MNIRPKYVLLCLCSILAASCNEKVDDTPMPEISVSGDFGTKALLNTIAEDGSKVAIYDYLTNFEGDIDGTQYTSSDVPLYFNSVVTKSGTEWNYDGNNHYRWTRTGTHNFFGWFTNDASESALNVSSLFGNALSLGSDKRLSIPTTALTTTSPQFDFAYSDIISRAAENQDYSPVVLPLNHLFTAICIQLENESQTNATIKDVTITNFRNSASAIVDFSDFSAGPQLTVTGPTVSGSYFSGISNANITLNKKGSATNTLYDILGKEYSGENYFIAWPMVGEDLKEGTVTIHYTLEDVYDDINPTQLAVLESAVKLPSMQILAGRKYKFRLRLVDKEILLRIEVQPWDFTPWQMDFSNESITVTSKLAFDPNTCTLDEPAAKVRDGLDIHGQFSITNPKGATWFIDITGDTSYFDYEVYENDEDGTIIYSGGLRGTINPDNAQGRINFRIKPKWGTKPENEEKSISLSFVAEWPDGREKNFDSEAIDDYYKVIWR